MFRVVFLDLILLFLDFPIYGQSKEYLCRRVLETAKSFKDIKPVYQIIKSDSKTFKYLPSIAPLRGGRLSSTFGYRIHPITKKKKFHSGVDLAAQYATTVHATADGTVIFAGNTRGYGKKVVVAHRYGFVTCYAHLTYIYTVIGRRVKKGQCIGFVGSTGLSTGNHLHYEVIKNKVFINPLNFY